MKTQLFYFIGLLFTFMCQFANAQELESNGKYFPQNPALAIVADKCSDIMYEAMDEYSFKKLLPIHSKCEQVLVYYYDSIHPDQTISAAKKAEMMLDELENTLDCDVAMTTIDMGYVINLRYTFLQYRMIALSKELIKHDTSFKKEIDAWQNLMVELDIFITSAIHIDWFNGSGASNAIIDGLNDIYACRVNDLMRLICMDDGKYSFGNIPSDSGRDTLNASIQDAKLRVLSSNEIKTGDDYKANALKELHRNVMNEQIIKAWDKWMKIRKTTSFSTINHDYSIKSASMLTIDLSNRILGNIE